MGWRLTSATTPRLFKIRATAIIVINFQVAKKPHKEEAIIENDESFNEKIHDANDKT